MAMTRFAAVVVVAVTSRLFVVTLQVLLNTLIPDHDADAFVSPRQDDLITCDRIVTFLFGGFKRWDAQYFLHIAQYGYTYENTLAFFPLYPLVVWSLGSTLHFVFGSVISFHTSLLVAGVSVNFFIFIVSCLFLYELSRIVLGNEETAFLSAFLFSINPASVFFSACYSETLYSALTLGGILCLQKNWKTTASFLLGLSGGTRSNGLLNGGFLIYFHLQDIMKMVHNSHRDDVYLIVRQIARRSMIFGFNLFLFLCPFVAFQVYACMLFCLSSGQAPQTIPSEVYELAKEKGYRLPSDQLPPWCHYRVPLSYSYVQNTYWNVGFLQYFEYKQIPNFFLVAPLLLLAGNGSFAYFKTVWRHFKLSYSGIILVTRDKKFVYFVHATALLVFCSLFIHVQVTTRLFASSSPVLYWIASSEILPEWKTVTSNAKEGKKDFVYFVTRVKTLLATCPRSKFIIIYFIMFTIVGTALHVNFLPWT